ncbi:hypothetical protein Tco_0901956 [Tanacetum coccineum]
MSIPSLRPLIMEYLVKISKKACDLELKQRNMKITVLTTNTPYPSRKIRRICACTSLKTTKETRSNTSGVAYAYDREVMGSSPLCPKVEVLVATPRGTTQVVRGLESEAIIGVRGLAIEGSRRPHGMLSLVDLAIKSWRTRRNLEEEVAETMAQTMEKYISKTRADYGSGVSRPKIEEKDNFELKGQFLKELRTNTFSGSDHEDANEHIKKVLEIVDLFHIPNITIDQVMLRAFLISLTGAASHWLKNKPSGSITTWEDLKTKFLSKYCALARTAKKMEEINNF